jgi:hypothetical protein
MKLTLKHPLEFGKIKVEELTFREYTTAADYLSFDRRGGVAQRIALIASMSGTDEKLIEQLRGSDYRRAEQFCENIMADDEAEAVLDKNIFPDKTPEQVEAEKK